MIKIIGKDDTLVKRCSCKNCATILEFNMIDVQKGYHTDYTGYREMYKFIICPQCQKEIKAPFV